MKDKARDSFIQQLTKVSAEQGLNLAPETLSDKELKHLYLKWQFVRSECKIGILKEETIEEALKEGNLMLLSFRDYHRYGVRKITFKEYLQLEKHIHEYPKSRKRFSGLLFQ